MLKKNVGGTDKYIRIVVGLILVFIGYREVALWATIPGALIFFSGWFGWCGLYALLGKSTCKNPPQDTPQI